MATRRESDRDVKTLSDREIAEQSLARARRIETRVTKIANHFGVDAEIEKPQYNAEQNRLYVTSPKCTIEDILAALGQASEEVDVYKGQEYLLTVST